MVDYLGQIWLIYLGQISGFLVNLPFIVGKSVSISGAKSVSNNSTRESLNNIQGRTLHVCSCGNRKLLV